MELTKLLSYENQGSTIFAWFHSYENKKVKFINEFNQTLSLTEDRLYFYESSDTPKSNKELHKIIAIKQEEVDLEKLWNITEEQFSNSIKDLTLKYFGELTFLNEYSLRTALIIKNAYFKRDSNYFIKRDLNSVELFKKQLEQELEDQKEDQAIIDFILLKQARKPEFFNKVIQFVSNAELTIPEQKRVKYILEKAFDGEIINLKIITYFIKNNLVPKNFNPIIHRYKYELKYPEVSYQFQEEDLLSEQCITIDDETTMDMDDAFSIKQLQNGYELGIYISNVAKYIDLNSIIAEHAKKTATSIYTADTTYHMLPNNLSEDFLSLRENARRSVIGIILKIDNNFEILSHEIKSGDIIVKEKLNYEKADEKIETDYNLNLLYQIAITHEQKRLARGAFQSGRMAPKIYFKDNNLEFGIYDESNFSRVLVSELMVITNNIFAMFCKDNNLPAVFRTQSPPEKHNIIINNYPEGVVRDYYSKTGLKPSKNTFKAAPHWGLGLDFYIQASSPIRRFLDLYNQSLIYAKLTNQEINYNFKIEEIEEKTSIANSIQRDSDKYWLLNYFRQNKIKEFSVTIMKVEKGFCLVYLNDYYVSLFARFEKKPNIGDKLLCKVIKIEPYNLEIRLEL